MLELGYNAVVLRYSLAPFVYPTQIYEAAYTVKWVEITLRNGMLIRKRIILAGFFCKISCRMSWNYVEGDMVATFARISWLREGICKT